MKTKGMIQALILMIMAVAYRWPFRLIGVSILLGMGIQFLIGLVS